MAFVCCFGGTCPGLGPGVSCRDSLRLAFIFAAFFAWIISSKLPPSLFELVARFRAHLPRSPNPLRLESDNDVNPVTSGDPVLADLPVFERDRPSLADFGRFERMLVARLRTCAGLGGPRT